MTDISPGAIDVLLRTMHESCMDIEVGGRLHDGAFAHLAVECVEHAGVIIKWQRSELAASRAREAVLVARQSAIPDQGSWAAAVAPLVRRCEVAVAVGGNAVWNSIGAQAHAELLKEMARILDGHKCALAQVTT